MFYSIFQKCTSEKFTVYWVFFSSSDKKKKKTAIERVEHHLFRQGWITLQNELEVEGWKLYHHYIVLYYIISLYWENDVVIIYPASTISKFERWLLCLCSHFVPEYENDSLFIAINQSWIGKKFIQLSFSKSLIFTKLPLRVIVGLLQKTCYVPREVRFQPRSMLWLFNSQSVIPRTIERPESFMAPKNLNATKNGNFHKETLYN